MPASHEDTWCLALKIRSGKVDGERNSPRGRIKNMSLDTSRARNLLKISHNLEEMDKNDLEAVLKMGKENSYGPRL